MTDSVSILAAFGAGLLSFVTPCCLALVPGYVSYVAGFSLAQADGPSAGRVRVAAVANTLTFALGFMSVFVLLGASLGALSQSLASFGAWLNRVSGIFIIALGLVTLGLLKVPFMERGFGVRFSPGVNLRYLGSFLVGATFAVGWTPCVGPILGAILILAGTSGSVEQGSLFLTSYSLGLMVPFVAAGVMTGWTSWLLRRHGHWLSYANRIAGVLLIALGIALFTGILPVLSSYLALGT